MGDEIEDDLLNEFEYVKRGTGLNNVLNIAINGANGSVLIVSVRFIIPS
ncbi:MULTISPECIES: hypothetical protein [unclassified Methanobrevibacter]|nr:MULTISPECIES: hypothetical protein [unclassified Methanobrevibacter]